VTERPATAAVEVRCSRWDDLDARTVHDLVRLRVDVFVVEQQCAYPELDGRDVEPGTLHLWSADATGPTSYLRLLVEPDGGRRIGRVATRADVRGRGLARGLLAAALGRCAATPVVLDAQSHLTGVYAALGFAPSGPEFVEDGIPHVPMRREA
jgi:ElaA protein